MGKSTVYLGQFVKLLKSNLSFKGVASILTGTTDPTSVATDAPKGSLLMRQTPGADGQVFKKNDDGSTTNWEALASAANVAAAYADYYDPNSTVLPDWAPLVDGSLLTSGQTAYFSNLSSNNGKIYKITTGASAWTTQYSGFGIFITQALASYGDRVVYAFLSNGSASRSTDGGDSYTSITAPGFIANSAYAFDENTIIVCGFGGNIKISTDAGATWTAQTSGTANSLRSIYFINRLVGWACGTSNTVIRTLDGGATWTAQTATGTLDRVRFADASNGYMAYGTTSLYKTTNGGTTWTATTAAAATLQDLHVADANTVYATGSDGKVYKTTNGGTSWNATATVGTGAALLGIYVKDSNNIYVTTNDIPGRIYSTSNGGSSWTLAFTASSSTYGELIFATNNKGWAIGGQAGGQRPIAGFELAATWVATKAFRNAQETSANGEIAHIGFGTKYSGHYVYKNSSGLYLVNDTRRFFDGNNGSNFLEISAIRTAVLADNAGSTTTYSSGTQNGNNTGVGPDQRYASTFVAAATGTVSTATLYPFKTGSDTGTIVAEIWSTSGGIPNTLIATSDSINVTTLPNAGPVTPTAFTFSTPPTLTSGVTYALGFRIVATGTSFGFYNTTSVGTLWAASATYMGAGANPPNTFNGPSALVGSLTISTAAVQLISAPYIGYQNLILDYSIVRGTTRETGILMVSASDTSVSVAPFYSGIGSTGVTFSGAITNGNIVISCATTNTGTAATMKYSMRRWGN